MKFNTCNGSQCKCKDISKALQEKSTEFPDNFLSFSEDILFIKNQMEKVSTELENKHYDKKMMEVAYLLHHSYIDFMDCFVKLVESNNSVKKLLNIEGDNDGN